MLREGMTYTQTKVVEANETAAKVASGALDVFATPMMIAFMESTAFTLAQKELEKGDTTVGISVDISHLKASLVGEELVCEAALLKIDGKKLDFYVKVTSGDILVGEGKHSRFIVNEEKFLAKLKK